MNVPVCQPLPEILPVFPLTGVLLLPGTVLPLHIFEPRYRNMVEDVLNSDGILGMIQPIVPQQDNRPLPGAENEMPALYKVGCAGHIDRWERLPDGRYMIGLRGVHRFRFVYELPLYRGYRRVKAVYTDFADTAPTHDWRCDRAALLKALEDYGRTQGFSLKMDSIQRFSDLDLINLLAVSLPFHPAEKQALLEAPSVRHREEVLVNLLRLGATLTPAAEGIARTLN